MAGAAVATGGVAAGAAMATGGGASAIQAAFAKAGENVANNTDVMSSLGGAFSGGSDFDEAGSFSQASGQSSRRVESSGGFKGSAVKAGRIAADTGANLMKGMCDMAGDRISGTTGGRLASSIRNSTKNDGDDDDKEGD